MNKNSKKQFDKKGKGSRYDLKAPRTNSRTTTRYREGIDHYRDNDVSWYTTSEQLLKDTASLPFSHPVGGTIQIPVDPLNETSTTNLTEPGIMNIFMAPVCGSPMGPTDPLNIAARNVFAYVRKANSGYSNYDAPDLMMYIIAVQSMASMYAWLTRFYGVARVYAQQNRYLGKYLVESQMVDWEDLVGNLANYRSEINTIAERMKALIVPRNFSIFDRGMWMFSGYYADQDTLKAQFYQYVPAYFHKYYDSGEFAGTLQPVWTPTWQFRKVKFSELIAMANDMLTTLVSSQDIAIMGGDILKAYGVENTFSVNQIADDYSLYPSYSEEVLTQIHNMRTLLGYNSEQTSNIETWGKANGFENFGVLKENVEGGSDGSLIMSTHFLSATKPITTGSLLDLRKESPTPADVMVATRLIPVCATSYLKAQKGWASTIKYSDWYVPIRFRVWAFSDGDGSFATSSTWVGTESVSFPSYWMHDYSAFDWAPRIYFQEQPGSDGKVKMLSTFGDLDNFTFVHDTTLQAMNYSALFAEVRVPQFGMYNG